MLEGIAPRMERNPISCTSKHQIKDHRPPNILFGGSILASLSTFQAMWISEEEYDENEFQIVHSFLEPNPKRRKAVRIIFCLFSIPEFGYSKVEPRFWGSTSLLVVES